MINPFKRIKQLEESNQILSQELSRYTEISNSLISPETVMISVLKRGLDWYDYNELEMSQKKSYWSDARAILSNSTFINEYNHFIAERIKEIAKDLNVEQIKYSRFGIVAMEAFKEHLEHIVNPDINATYDNVNDGI